MRGLKRRIAKYYLTLRLSAAVATPMLDPVELKIPTPIVRRLPAELHEGWDRREIVQRDGIDYIVTRGMADSSGWSINLN
ncbi:MAG TPA: hypothetical protein VKZ96_03680 [Thermomicrobiales bacterium]|nr:hypothetical protein [Thermomicrobiales bacterium]